MQVVGRTDDVHVKTNASRGHKRRSHRGAVGKMSR